MFMNNKAGGFVFHIGGPILLLLLLVVFVLISLSDQALAAKITESIANVAQAVTGAIK